MKVQTLYNYHVSECLLHNTMKQPSEVTLLIKTANDNTDLWHLLKRLKIRAH